MFVKIHNVNTTLVEKNELNYKDSYKGIYLDIMALGGFPEGEEQQKVHALKLQQIVRLNRKRRQPFSQNYKFRSKITWLLTVPFHALIPLGFYPALWTKIVEKYPYESSEYVGYAWSPRVGANRIFPKEWFGEGIELPFEDTTMRCPIAYDAVLTRVFGDYMTLPPEEDRKTHSKAILDFQRSYREYQK